MGALQSSVRSIQRKEPGMCLALPAEIVEVGPDGETAIVSLDGIRKEISLVLVDGVGPGDFVLVHVSGGAKPGDAL